MVTKKIKAEIIYVGLEIVLIFAAVLIFRSLWLILDNYAILHQHNSLVIMLCTGILLTIVSVEYLLRHKKEYDLC